MLLAYWINKLVLFDWFAWPLQKNSDFVCTLWTHERHRLIRNRRISYSSDRRLLWKWHGNKFHEKWGILSRISGVTIDGVCIGDWMYWHTNTHNSELQVITAPPLISTTYKSLQHPLSLFPACSVFISHSLATACNRGDSSAPRAQVLSSQPPAQNPCQLTTLN
jgi:hypothetical protein